MHQCADMCGVPKPGSEIRVCGCGKIWVYHGPGGFRLPGWRPAGWLTRWLIQRHDQKKAKEFLSWLSR